MEAIPPRMGEDPIRGSGGGRRARLHRRLSDNDKDIS